VVELFSLFQAEPKQAEINAAHQEKVLKDLPRPCHHSPFDNTFTQQNNARLCAPRDSCSPKVTKQHELKKGKFSFHF